MTCTRCEGLMVPVAGHVTADVGGIVVWGGGVSCLQCGDVLDAVIWRNRHLTEAERVALDSGWRPKTRYCRNRDRPAREAG